MTRLISWTTGAMKSPRRRIVSFWTAGRKEAATTTKPRAADGRAPFHEAAHAVVAVLLGLRARAELHDDSPGCGATDIDAPLGPEGTERLLVALVAGSEGEGRLLGGPRQWHVSLEDARAIVRLLGGVSDENAARLARAKQSAERIVRDVRVWSAIESVAAELERASSADHHAVVGAVTAAGLAPASFGAEGG
ncbi:MAG: hypothetical protein ACRDGT_02410 [Candidatus Limnocylindria bacterium]